MREPVWLILSLHQKLRSAFQDSSYIISKSASGVTTYICPFCKFSTIDKTEMKNHMLTHTGPRQHSCDIWSLIKCEVWHIQVPLNPLYIIVHSVITAHLLLET
ncbi:hypothetical protein JTE90_015122 [Oedothorax gibbosus]|uniref:C2H2-type domain-containing protein n=1 Tax=Oedothorax gibbosus TaxID=931172 RepID=A0AAV6VTX3_9ARAC|nr:hypothetical protein JTE90_015122 [Oedothorax gibbosus]